MYSFGFIALMSAIVTAIISIKIRHNFVPKLTLDIEQRFIPEKRAVILKLIIENISSVYIPKDSIRLQVLEYKWPLINTLSEWVPFNKSAIKDGEDPIKWTEPIEVFSSTTGLQPQERLSVERLHILSDNADFLHVGFQYFTKLGPIVSRLVPEESRASEKWTTTAFVCFEKQK